MFKYLREPLSKSEKGTSSEGKISLGNHKGHVHLKGTNFWKYTCSLFHVYCVYYYITVAASGERGRSGFETLSGDALLSRKESYRALSRFNTVQPSIVCVKAISLDSRRDRPG